MVRTVVLNQHIVINASTSYKQSLQIYKTKQNKPLKVQTVQAQYSLIFIDNANTSLGEAFFAMPKLPLS